MALHVVGELLAQRGREVAAQRGGDPRILGQVRGQQLVEQPHLAVGEQHRVLGAVRPLLLRAPLGNDLVVGQELDGAIQPPGLLEEPHEAHLRVEQRRRDAVGDRQHLRLEIVVAQHQRGDVVGHLRQQRVALLLRQLAVGDRQPEQDLDVDLVVRGVDAGRVVDRVGVDAPARRGELDAAELRAAEVAALGDDLAAQLAAVDAHRVVGAVADLGVRLVLAPSHRCRCRRCRAGRPAPSGWR